MDKWFAVAVIGVFGSFSAMLAYVKGQESKVDIACYEAAKTNHTLKCDIARGVVSISAKENK